MALPADRPAGRAPHCGRGGQPDARRSRRSRRLTPRRAAARYGSTSAGPTCSRGRSSTAPRPTSSSAPTRRRWTSRRRPARSLPGSRVDLVGNQLAVVAAAGACRVRAPRVRARPGGDPAHRDRRSGGGAGRRLRAAVPRAKGLWQAYEPRIVPTTNVRAALTAVETGERRCRDRLRDRSARRGSPRRARVRRAGGRRAPRIVYPRRAIVADVARSQAEAARGFSQFLRRSGRA